MARAYVITTGAIFALILVAHVLRIAEEGSGLATDPVFVGFSILSAMISGWAVQVFRRIPPGT